MICENCGGRIGKGDTYCPFCGRELKSSEYKPLQKRYIRGEYQEREENFHEERPAYQEPETKKYHRGYDLDEYYPDEEEPESSGRSMLPVILFLVIALLIGFILGIIMFSSNFQTIPSINTG